MYIELLSMLIDSTPCFSPCSLVSWKSVSLHIVRICCGNNAGHSTWSTSTQSWALPAWTFALRLGFVQGLYLICCNMFLLHQNLAVREGKRCLLFIFHTLGSLSARSYNNALRICRSCCPFCSFWCIAGNVATCFGMPCFDSRLVCRSVYFSWSLSL